MSFGVGGTTTAKNQIFQALSTGTDQRTMKPVLDRHRHTGLLTNSIRNDQDSSLGVSDTLLRASDGNVGIVFSGLVDVDLGVGVVLDFVDVDAAFTEDPSDGARRNRELDRVVGLLLEF